ncbi:MAG: proton-conducting transporter membrane subunit [Planctomycetota bacterium]
MHAAGIASFMLIGIERDATARKAAQQALLITAGGGLALLAGLVLLAQAADSWSLAQILERPEQVLASPLSLPMLLLLLIGAVDHATGLRDATRLRGLGRHMPWTWALAGLAACSLAGLPPLLGFVGKEMALDESLHAAGWWLAILVALAGLVLGLHPPWLQPLISPAVAALCHLLRGLPSRAAVLRRQPGLLYRQVIHAVKALAWHLTRRIQNGSLRWYLGWVLVAMVGLTATGFLAGGGSAPGRRSAAGPRRWPASIWSTLPSCWWCWPAAC